MREGVFPKEDPHSFPIWVGTRLGATEMLNEGNKSFPKSRVIERRALYKLRTRLGIMERSKF